MAHNLTSNEWGFSVTDDSPFAIFRYLQKVAREQAGEEHVIDLSRGDPGYGFSPSAKGRRFYSFLLMLDQHFSRHGRRFQRRQWDADEKITDEIRAFAERTYAADIAEAMMGDLTFFCDEIVRMAAACGLDWTKIDVMTRMFDACAVSGGTYLNPQGEEITRVVLADWYQRFLPDKVVPSDIIVFQGASHAIGTLFKALGGAGLGYLNEGDTGIISSPVYAPYNTSLLNLGIRSFVISIDPITGGVSDESLKHLENHTEKMKVLILIDPNNPTGFSLDEKTLARLAAVARKHNALVITDEVYVAFFPRKKTLADFCPERLLRIDARSKIERSTGLRFGDLYVSKEANDYISGSILGGLLSPGQDLKSFLIQAKGPGGTEGELQHTTFVPGPSQFLGIAHMVLGKEEREQYLDEVRENSRLFAEILGLPHKGNLYYTMFDLNSVATEEQRRLPVERKLLDLAIQGVVYLPAYLFFAEHERIQGGINNMVRASVVNTTSENIKKAATITRNYLTQKQS